MVPMLVALALVAAAVVTAAVAHRRLGAAARVLGALDEPVDPTGLELVQRSSGALRDVVGDRTRR